MLEGKTVNGQWEPGKINRILGRNLECGQRSWYRKVWDYTQDGAWYDFKTRVLRQDWYVECQPQAEEYRDFYNLQTGLTKRKAHRLVLEWTGHAVEGGAAVEIWMERDRATFQK